MGVIDIDSFGPNRDLWVDDVDSNKYSISRSILTNSSGKLRQYVLDADNGLQPERPMHLVIKESGIETPQRNDRGNTFQIVRLSTGELAE